LHDDDLAVALDDLALQFHELDLQRDQGGMVALFIPRRRLVLCHARLLRDRGAVHTEYPNSATPFCYRMS